MECEGLKLRLKKDGGVHRDKEQEQGQLQGQVQQQMQLQNQGQPDLIPAVSMAEDGNIFQVIAPLTGVFYAAPSPDAPPFAKIGDKFMPDSPLCIIEAMKIMNEIEAEVAGEVLEILVQNEQVVEAGQAIMVIRRNTHV